MGLVGVAWAVRLLVAVHPLKLTDDVLVKESWFICWLLLACGSAWLLWGAAGVVFTFSAICAIRAERSL
jgi:hypothetical protein